MSAPQPIQRLVTDILRHEARKESTTKDGIAALALNKISRSGGPHRYGLGEAAYIAWQRHVCIQEADRQMKRGLPDNCIGPALKNAPPEIAQQLPKLPYFIALAEGRNAPWVFSLRATAEQWMANAKLKEVKAQQTMGRADASMSIAMFLRRYGVESLSEALPMDVAAE